MTDTRARAKALFLEALDRPPAEREAFVRERAAGDVAACEEALALLAAHAKTAGFLDGPPPVGAGSGALAAGMEIDGYVLERPLGEGGMGVVWLARQERPVRRKVAMKVLRAGLAALEFVPRFEAERDVLARMQHPGIAAVFDAGTAPDGRPYLVMELVEGRSLVEFANAERLAVRERVALLVEVCRAVEHAHSRGVLHRDLKPSNVLVARVDGEPRPKVIDFGVAKALDAPMRDEALRTRVGTLIGTPGYMAPEQAELGAAAVDTRADVFSLGAILFELLSGARPLEPDVEEPSGPGRLARLAAEGEAPPLSSVLRRDPARAAAAAAARRTDPRRLARELRGELEWIAARALDPDPSRRYGSVAELRADLERYLAGEPVEAGPPSAAYRLAKLVRRHRLAAATVAAVLLALGVGVAALAIGLREARLARRELGELSDALRLERLLARLDTLPFAGAADAPALVSWCAEARALAERAPVHRARLARLLAQRAALVEGAHQGGASSEAEALELDWQIESTARLLDRLEAFARPRPERASVARGEWELAASRVAGEAARDLAWEGARRSIADPAECPAYRGLDLPPQEGLVPLGRDPASGLWEFLVPLTGTAPERAADGRLVVTEESGLVLVLLPGGTFRMGTPEGEGGGADERPVNEVTLDPFFLAKHEMTQGQWLRLEWANPAEYRPGREDLAVPIDLSHPIENVSALEARAALLRVGLDLPTEAQWEYAARAGTTTRWWTGDDPASLVGAGNLFDEAAAAGGLDTLRVEESLPPADGFLYTAPVGRFRPNPFGLWDVVGNVWEWCRDAPAPYTRAARPGDGLRGEVDAPFACGRGGSFADGPERARSANRNSGPREYRQGLLGVRPARAVIGAEPAR